jgi:hypothetical protein
MGLVEEDLRPMLTVIQERAEYIYWQHLQSAGYGFDEHKNVVVTRGPQATYEALAENLPAEQENWRIFSEVLSKLLDRFRFFHWLDRGNIHDVEVALGSTDTALPLTPEPDITPGDAGGAHADLFGAFKTVNTRLRYGLLDLVTERLELDQTPVPVSGDNRDQRDRHPVEVISNHWDGPSATAFYGYMYLPFYEAAARQVEYVRELTAAATSFGSVHDYAAEAITTVAQNCINAFHGKGSYPFDWKTVEGAKIAYKGWKLFKSVRSGQVMGAINNARAVYTSVKSFIARMAEEEESKKHLNLDVKAWYPGIPPAFTLGSCNDAITSLMKSIADYDARLGSALEQDMSSVDSFNSAKLWLREPGTFSADHDFDVSTEAKAEEEGIETAIDNLREAGLQVLPGVAEQYEDAIKDVMRCSLPVWLDHFLPRSKTDFEDAQDRLVHLLRTTSDNLEKWGKELVEVADGYGEAEEDNTRTVGSTMD